ncbi:ATP-grasp domain-containing protein [Streptomyces sp. NPDC005012]|uniref:ATP-grasp domain-containing protein n=1 Tax=Streptomyces sp. NPDC005012 TaxID=3154558 RepID=UPI0033A5DFE7
MSDRPVLVVIYDEGSATVLDVTEGLEPLGDVVLALWPSPHTRTVQLLAEELVPVVVLSEDPEVSARLLRAHRPDAVLTFSEKRLHDTARLAVRLGLPYHSPETVDLLRDKHAQRTRLREHGVDSVRHHRLERPADWEPALAAVGLPAVLKPAGGLGSRSTHLVETAEQGAALAAALLTGADPEPLVLEEFLRGQDRGRFGDYVSVESAVSAGGISHWAVTGKFPLSPPFRETGQLRPAALAATEREDVLALVTAALRALGVTRGVTHTEVKLTPDGPRIIEVNGRLGGWQVQLARLAGDLDPVTLAGRVALGEDVSDVRAQDEQVVFTRSFLAPYEGGTYAGVHGLRAASALEGVKRINCPHAPGDRLPPGVHTSEVGWVEAVVADHDAMFRLAERVAEELSFVVEPPREAPEAPREEPGAVTALAGTTAP